LSNNRIISIDIDAIDKRAATRKIISWAKKRQSSYVCFSNVHMVMEAYDDQEFKDIVNSADLALPDGMPLVWMLKGKRIKQQERVCGPDMTILLCEVAAKEGIEVGFYGSSPEILEKLVSNLKGKFPELNVVCAISPPYRTLTNEETEHYTNEINESGAKILFVGLGCPKQEKWMKAHKNKIHSVMLGVGAAFDFHSGSTRVAPPWMQKIGMEWFYRLLQDPKRLWKRYVKHNPRFIVFGLFQLVREQRSSK